MLVELRLLLREELVLRAEIVRLVRDEVRRIRIGLDVLVRRGGGFTAGVTNSSGAISMLNCRGIACLRTAAWTTSVRSR